MSMAKNIGILALVGFLGLGAGAVATYKSLESMDNCDAQHYEKKEFKVEQTNNGYHVLERFERCYFINTKDLFGKVE